MRAEEQEPVAGSKVESPTSEENGTVAARARLAAIVESSDDAIISKTLDGIITSWNAAAERMYGYSAAEAVGRHISLIGPPDRHAEFETIHEMLRRGKRVESYETVRQAKDGRLLNISLTVSPIHDANGHIVGASAIARDVTTQTRMKEILRRQEAQQAAVARLGALALEGIELEALMEVAVQEVAGQLDVEYCKVLELLPEGGGLLLKAGVGWKEGLVGRAVVGRGTDSQAGYTLLSEEPVVVNDLSTDERFSGPPLLHDHAVVSGVSVVIKGVGGQPYGVLGAHSRQRVLFTEDDLHFVEAVANLLGEAVARKHAERQTRFQADMLAKVNDGVMALDREQRIVYLNNKLAALLHVDPQEALGKTISELYQYHWLNPGDAEAVSAALRESGAWKGEVIMAPHQGPEFIAEFSVTVLQDEKGEKTGWLSVVRDETERRRSEQRTRFLAQASSVLASSLDYEETLQSVAGLIVPELADWCAIFVTVNEGVLERVAVAHADPDKVKLALEVHEKYPPDPEAPQGTANVIRTGTSEFIAVVSDEMIRATARDAEHYRLVSELGLHSYMNVPLVARGRVLGAVTLIMAETDRSFTEADLAFAEELARRCALSVDNARLYREAQNEIAERIWTQEALRENERLLRFTLEATHVGTWSWDLQTDTVQWSGNLERIHRMEPGAFDGTFEAFFKDVMPEDRVRVQETIQKALEARGDYHVEYRLPPKAGEENVVWVEGKGTVVCDDDGKPIRMAGICMDITERKQAEETLYEKTRTLETLNEINTSLAAQLDLDKLVQAVTDAGTELTGAEFGAFFYNVMSGQGESYMLYALSGVPHEAFSSFPMPRNTKIFTPTFSGEKIVRIDDVTKDPRYGKNAPFYGMPEGHLPVHSYLAVPVMGRAGEVLGGLFFGHSEVGVFSEQAEIVIEGIAAQAAIAIENARLYESARRELAERRKAEALVSAQKHILEQIAQGAPLEDVLALIVRTLEEQAGDDLMASIMLIEEGGDQLLHGAAPSLPDAYNEAIHGIEIGEGVGSCGTVAHRGEAVVVSDIAADPLWADFRDLALEHGLQACWSTPILDTRGRVIGTFALYYPEPQEPAALHQHLVSIMTRTAAIAIERHRAEQKLRDWNETLEHRVVQRTIELETTNARLQEEVAERKRAEGELERTNIRLTQRNRELQDFAYVASHDLQEPLRKVQAFADLMAKDYEEVVDETGHYYLERMQDAARRMSNLINDLLAYSRVATRARAFEPVDLDDLLEGVMSDLEVSIQEKNAQIEVGELPTIEADPTQMWQLFQNLIGNALKFQQPDVTPVIQISAEVKESNELTRGASQPVAHLAIKDNGIGFDAQHADRIFSPFQRLHSRGTYPGSGIGLAICRRIVERHGGTITAQSVSGEGATFCIALPVHQEEGEMVEG